MDVIRLIRAKPQADNSGGASEYSTETGASLRSRCLAATFTAADIRNCAARPGAAVYHNGLRMDDHALDTGQTAFRSR